MSQDSRWQQLIDAVKARFQLIRVVNGYESEVGAHIFSWRDLSASPFQPQELPAICIRDPKRETTTEARVINAHYHELTIEVLAASCATGSSPPENFARRILSDIDQAIGVDRQWTINGSKLAIDTLPVSDEIESVHVGDRIVGVKKTFTIIFRTGRFDPYTA